MSRRSQSSGSPPLDGLDASAADAGGAPSDSARGSTGPTDASDGSGVRVEMAVLDPPHAPVAATLPPNGVARDVERARVDGTVVSQFRADRPVDAELVFEGDGELVYRCRSRPGDPLPSRAVESLGHPVSTVAVRTDPDRVRLTLSLPDADPLGEVVDALEAAGGSVRLERLTSSGGADSGSDPVVVDRGRLTDRQREVVRTAERLGYFEYPREANAAEVAEAVGIARATFSEHLAAAQRRVFDDLVGE